MRIGIDATAVPAVRAGAGNYIFNLVRGISEVDSANMYTVFARSRNIQEWGIRQPNFAFYPVELPSRPVRLIWEQTVLPVLARRHNLEVLHSPHYTFPVFARVRRVVTVLDMTFYLFPQFHSLSKRALFKTMIPLATRYADRIITISESTARDLLRLEGRPGLAEKTHPIPLAVDPAFRPISDLAAVASVCNRFGLTPGGFLLSVGVLEPRKNLPVLLRAYRRLRDEGFPHSLAIVGKRGWMFDSILATVQSLELSDYVIFTDYIPLADLPYVYNGAAVFVYPSIYEGFGLPVLEALACRAPVVSSDISSIPEIVGDAGLLVPPSDADALFRALKRILCERDLAERLAERGLERAAQFSWNRTARQTVAVYERAIER